MFLTDWRGAAAAAAAAADKEAKQRRILEGTWKLEKIIGKDGAGKLENPWEIGVSPDGNTVAIADAWEKQGTGV